MSVVSVRARSFILALFIRDDGERFLLGDNGFDFKDSQLHFAANTIENDEVAKQGVDGIMLAGQVRRASVQSFDGYVGDGTTLKEEVERMRREFFAFFASGHHFRVIYIDCNKNAWQRKGGYLVDAPEVKELWQIHPEYHVGLNFEDVNYYGYDENAEGEEILSNIISVPISSDVEGGLVWDENGAVSEPAVVEYDTETTTASGTNISISDAAAAPISSFSLKGNTSQQTYTGKNLCGIPDQTFTHLGVTVTIKDGEVTMNGTSTGSGTKSISPIKTTTLNGSYTTNLIYVSGTAGSGNFNLRKASDNTVVQGTQTSYFNSNQSVSYSIANTDVNFGIYILSSGTVFTNYKFKVQIVASSTADYDFEPYVGGTASPNPDYPQPVQTVAGENVVKICRKNLFDKDNYDSLNAYVDGSTIKASTNNVLVWIHCQPSTSYAITVVGSNVTTSIYSAPNIPVVEGTANWLGGIAAGDTTGVFTTKPKAKYIVVRIWTNTSSQTVQEALDALQIELGSTATAYEPYQGQSYEVNLGKNLFDKTDFTGVTDHYIGGGGRYTQANGNNVAIMRIEPNTTYTVSKEAQATNNRLRVGISDELVADGTVFSIWGGGDTATSVTLTSGSNSKYMYIYYAVSNNASTALESLQIEKGSQATSYAAYFEPIELCKIGTYQDYIYKSDGKWYVHKEIATRTFNGTDTDIFASGWFSSSETTSTTQVAALNILSLGARFVGHSYALMQHFSYVADNVAPTNGKFKLVNNASGKVNHIRIALSKSEAADLTAAKAWMATNQPRLYFVAYTPTDTEITNQALVAQLEAVLAGSTYAGTNNIATVISAGNAQGELEITYYTKYDVKVASGGYVWEAGGEGGPTIVMNESISEVSPVWTVYGPALNPVLENTTTGEQIEYVGMVGEGQTLVVNMGEQTASLDGLNVISNIVGDYLTLAPGSNTLLFSAESAAPASQIGWSEIVG